MKDFASSAEDSYEEAVETAIRNADRVIFMQNKSVGRPVTSQSSRPSIKPKAATASMPVRIPQHFEHKHVTAGMSLQQRKRLLQRKLQKKR